MRMARKLPDLDPGTMLHRSVVKVDLEPVPDDDGRAGKSQDVLHCAPVIWIWTSRPSMGRSERPGQRGDSLVSGGSVSAWTSWRTRSPAGPGTITPRSLRSSGPTGDA